MKGHLRNRQLYWHLLSRDEQAEAVKRLAASGMSDHTISTATGLTLEQIRKIIGESKPGSTA